MTIDDEDREGLLAMIEGAVLAGGHGTFCLAPDVVEFVIANAPDDLLLTRFEEADNEGDGLVAYAYAVARECPVCGENAAANWPDPCLGTLAGVAEACCGHGNPEEAYMRFTDGPTIRGFTVDR